MKKSDYLTRQNLEGKEQSIFYSLFTPVTTEVKATLIILHGMQEHSGRYDEVANYFCEKGIAVLTYDHLGHGKTAKTKDEHGFFQLKNPVGQLIEDARLMTTHLHQLFPEVPHYILGHSMGSFITRSYLQESHDLFDRAVIVGTGGKVKGIGVLKNTLAVFNAITPRVRCKLLNGLFGKMNNTRFKNDANVDGTNWLSLNEQNRKDFLSDPLNGIPFTYNGFYTLLSVTKRATQDEWANAIPKDFPMLFVSGKDDPIGDFGKGVNATVSNLQKRGFLQISLLLYPSMRHEILNEINRLEVFEDIYNWIDK